MITMELGKAINFSEERLMQIIDDLVSYENLDCNGEETDAYINQAIEYIEHELSDKDAISEVSDFFTDIASRASSYAYKEGFKEGIRLFRTLMHI